MNLQNSEVRALFSGRQLTYHAQYGANKGFAEDLSEGKFSFPIVHGIHADTTNRRLLSAVPLIIWCSSVTDTV